MMKTLCLLALCGSAVSLHPMYDCAVCKAVVEKGLACEDFEACGMSAVVEGATDCIAAGVCEKMVDAERTSATSEIDLRVTKGMGTKDYSAIRVSVVTENGHEPANFSAANFEFSSEFKWKWTDNSIHSSIVAHPHPGQSVKMDVGGSSVNIKIPALGAGVAGLIIGDPCFKSTSFISDVGCTHAKEFDTENHTPMLMNAIMEHNDTDFWAVLGDNYYDQKGKGTREFYGKLSLETKANLMMTVPGNHDYWIMAAPALGSEEDQFSNGFVQWYAMDAKTAEELTPGRAENKNVSPFNLSHDPRKGSIIERKNLPPVENSFWYQQIGNVGFVGYSGAYSQSTTLDLMKEACQWLGENKRGNGKGTIDVAALVGHWDKGGGGSDKDMAVPEFYDEMASLEGCAAYNTSDNLKFFMGHTHCNEPHPHGRVNAGFMVAGQGMEGCGNYGFPIFDTTEGRVRVWHFEVVSKKREKHFDDIYNCIRASGWRACTHLATLWLDQPITK